jgi:2'-5' RNA ligase
VTAVRGAPVVSIELTLDAATERAVRAEWQALADAGLSSLAAHTSPSNAPHVTLLVREAVTLASVPRPGAFAVTLGAVVLFGAGERRVLARSVVPSVELLALHAAVHAAAGPGDDAPHTAPGEWMPHVTLARRLKVADLERALPLLGDSIAGTARGLRRWDAASATLTELGVFGG